MALTDPLTRSISRPSGPDLSRLRHRLSGRPLAGFLFPLALLALWQAGSATGWLSTQVLPSPAQVWAALADLWGSGDLARHGAISLQRIVLGFAIGAGLGLVVGIGMGLSSRLEAVFNPTITAIAQVPLIGWLPFLIIIAGLGEAPKIIIIAKAAFLPMALNAFDGVRSIPPQYFEVAHTLRFSYGQLLRRIVLPGTTGRLFTGLRYGLTKSWTALVAVELLASSEGVGYLLVWGRQMFWMDLVIAAMIFIGVAGYALDRIFAAMEARMSRWRPERLS